MNSAKKARLMRPGLRKGKWTVRRMRVGGGSGLGVGVRPLMAMQAEEEEYTERIIQLFNSGLLPVPEGTTLRAFLAEKLNW
jgi:hypothetical protein